MPSGARARRASIGAAVIASIAASSCCIGPLVLAALGVGGAGALATLSAYRPYILVVTVVLLGAGYYLTYRPPRAADGCGCERPRASRAGKLGLWLATVAVALFAAFPVLGARLARARDADDLADNPSVLTAKAVLRVQGVDCEACSAHLGAAMKKVGGFHGLKLDLRTKTVTVRYEPAPGRLEAYVAAIDELGYEASIEPPAR